MTEKETPVYTEDMCQNSELKSEEEHEMEKATRILTYKEIRTNEEINLLIEKGNEVLGALGFTEHSRKHAAKVADTAAYILESLGYEAHQIELSKICLLYTSRCV